MVKTKVELEEMLKRADRLNRLDSYVAELINSNPYDTVNSKIFDINGVLTNSISNRLDRGVVYNMASGQVVPLPSNDINCLFKDSTNNILYVGTTAGLWQYNLTTRVGKVYNTAGGAEFGVQLPNNNVISIVKDIINNVVYVGTNGGGLWVYYCGLKYGRVFDSMDIFIGDPIPSDIILSLSLSSNTAHNVVLGTSAGVWKGTVANVALNTGKLFDAAGGAGVGDQLPNNLVYGISCDISLNTLYAATNAGVWQYNITTDTGKVYNTAGGAGAGQQLTSNSTRCIVKDSINNILYVGTLAFGIWQYNVATDTGIRYRTTGGATNGVQLPDDGIRSLSKDESDNILYVGTGNGVWRFDANTSTGLTYKTTGGATNGVQLPSNYVSSVFIDSVRNVLYAGTKLTSAGVWQYAYLSNVNYNGTQTRTVTYQQFTTDILNEPIMIDHIRLMCSDASQFNKPIKLYYSTPNGKVESKYYSTMINRMATDGDQTVLDINLSKPIAFSSENYFALDILPSTTIFFTVFYRQVNKWELLSNIIGFRDNQFESEKSKTL